MSTAQVDADFAAMAYLFAFIHEVWEENQELSVWHEKRWAPIEREMHLWTDGDYILFIDNDEDDASK